MRHGGLFIAGLTTLLIGIVGMAAAAVWLVGPSGFESRGTSPYSSAGERIYFTGIGDDGSPIPRTVGRSGLMGRGMMADLACVTCHGEDGRGGRVAMMMGFFDAEDIRYSKLTSPGSEDGESTPGWSDEDIARAIRDGIEPSGERLKAPMPRWDMTDNEIEEILAYLKEL